LKRLTAEPIFWHDKLDGKSPTYASLVLEHKPGKERRVRAVFRGHLQGENPIWTSRNTDMAAKKLFLNMIVSEGMDFMTLDIKDFYPAEMNLLEEVEYMVLKEQYVTAKYKKKYGHVMKNGRLLLKLKRSIYGMKQAGHISQRNLIKILEGNGYAGSDYNCICANTEKTVTFVTHLDDFGVGYKNKRHIEKLIEVLKGAGYTITVDWEGKKICGFEIELVKGVQVAMTIKKTIERTRFGRLKHRDCPYLISEMSFAKVQLEQQTDEPSMLDEKQKTLLQEKVGLLRYIAGAVFVRLELAVGKIAANKSKPTVALMEQADHVLGYLQSDADRGIRFLPSDMVLRAHSDASYGCESNLRYRTGSSFSVAETTQILLMDL